MNKAKILIVEDEADIRELIALHLTREGYVVEEAFDGEQAQKTLKNGVFDLIVLDWMLPGLSGLEIAREIRQSNTLKNIPVLMVTARMEAADIVLGLEAGADDYVTKPFEIPVLLARVRSLLRRALRLASPENPNELIKLGELVIDPKAYQVRCRGTELVLTPSEFKLLLTLAQNRGRVLTRDRLIDAVQGIGVSVVDRAIDTHVFGLRKKLGACSEWVETVRGVGYRIRGESND
jgi:two-component system phosphate regulon response regulator PhoB